MKGLTGWARCPGTCGEWVQGAKNGIPFLIDCPVNRFVETGVEIHLTDDFFKQDVLKQNLKSSYWNLPQEKGKTLIALDRLAKEYQLPSFRGQIYWESQLPEGKGMASSTADMIAAMAAVKHAFQIPVNAEVLAKIALEVEPTDPVMYEGITEFAHRDGSYAKSLGPVMPSYLLMLDWGGSLDTQKFNAQDQLAVHYRKNEKIIRGALAHFYEGMETRDLEKIAYASTISARCNQEINPKPNFESFLTWVKKNEGLGVVTAHSGTLLAGVFPIDSSLKSLRNIEAEARSHFGAAAIDWVKTCNGGVQGGMSNARWESIRSNGEVWQGFVY